MSSPTSPGYPVSEPTGDDLDWLKGYVCSRGVPPADADDVVQEILITQLLLLETHPPHHSNDRWALNTAIMRQVSNYHNGEGPFRYRKREHPVSEVPEPDPEPEAREQEWLRYVRTVYEQVKALAPEGDFRILRRKHEDGESWATIGEDEGVSAKTMKVRGHRIRQDMRIRSIQRGIVFILIALMLIGSSVVIVLRSDSQQERPNKIDVVDPPKPEPNSLESFGPPIPRNSDGPAVPTPVAPGPSPTSTTCSAPGITIGSTLIDQNCPPGLPDDGGLPSFDPLPEFPPSWVRDFTGSYTSTCGAPDSNGRVACTFSGTADQCTEPDSGRSEPCDIRFEDVTIVSATSVGENLRSSPAACGPSQDPVVKYPTVRTQGKPLKLRTNLNYGEPDSSSLMQSVYRASGQSATVEMKVEMFELRNGQYIGMGDLTATFGVIITCTEGNNGAKLLSGTLRFTAPGD